MNETIMKVLKKLSTQYGKDPSKRWKQRAMKKAIVSLKDADFKIKSGKEAQENLEFIGKGIAGRIDEILETGTLAELKKETKEDLAIREFKKITGVGPVKAKKWVHEDKVYSIKELQKAGIPLTHHIEIGLRYYEDFQKKIPRKEIDKFCKEFKKVAMTVDKYNIFEICGSYRRGKAESGDVDVLLGNTQDSNYLSKVIDKLEEVGICIDHLTKKGQTKYMGVFKTGTIARRLDIRFVRMKHYYTTLLYFTGSANFNVKMRQNALDEGYSLSEYGLTDIGTEELVTVTSEKEVFDILDMEYVIPTER